MRIILIDTSIQTSRGLESSLRTRSIHVYSASSEEEGLELARHYEHDLIILCISAQKAKDFDFLRTLHGTKACAPIIILSDDGSTASKVRALELGADTYLSMPFDMDELIARIEAMIRRRHGHYQSEITTGLMTIDLSSRSVSVKGTPVHLSTKEYQILELLSLRKGAMLTKDIFIEHLYGDEDGPESRTVELFMCKLRRKLSKATGGARYIETVGHRGYVLTDPAQ